MAGGAAGESRRGQMRRRIMTDLCGRRRTARELAEEFGISSTAVRDHLAVLLEEGLVTYGVERRGPGKPTHVYELTAEGESRLSRAYPPVLSGVLTSVEESAGATELESVLRSAGLLLTVEPAGAERPLGERVGRAAASLEELGGLLEVMAMDGGYTIQSRCCPLGLVTPSIPLACKVLEAMVARVTGATVREHCDRSSPPHCRFDITEPAPPPGD